MNKYDTIVYRDEPKSDNIKEIVTKFFVNNPDLKNAIVEIRPLEASRTIAQNSLLWTWYTIIGQEIGYSTHELHRILKARFLQGKSTTLLTTAEFSYYLNQIDMFCQDYNITLPYGQDYKTAMDIT